jgi:hypothetical protein
MHSDRFLAQGEIGATGCQYPNRAWISLRRLNSTLDNHESGKFWFMGPMGLKYPPPYIHLFTFSMSLPKGTSPV